MRVLAIGAHSDDMDEFCGGTLALYAQQGHTVGIACLTDGRAYGSVSPVEALVAARKREFEASAALIGASQTFWLGYPDGQLEPALPARRALEEIFHQFAPDILITHPADDYHPDHTAAHTLVMDASRYTPLFFCESEGGHNFIPDEYVDISAVFELKLKMMDVHRSQYDFGPDPQTGQVRNFLHDDVIALGRFHGMQAGVPYAEVFQICRKHGRIRAVRMLP